jgi:hypothetical protein
MTDTGDRRLLIFHTGAGAFLATASALLVLNGIVGYRQSSSADA